MLLLLRIPNGRNEGGWGDVGHGAMSAGLLESNMEEGSGVQTLSLTQGVGGLVVLHNSLLTLLSLLLNRGCSDYH